MRLRRITAMAFLAALVSIGLVSEGQAGGGTAITTCGQVVTTSAFLTKNLLCGGMTGVVVGASGITIDLKGFSLIGSRSPGDFGIDDSAGYDRVSVKNGVVRGFELGVAAYGGGGADNVSISNLVASGNAVEGIYVNGASAKIHSSEASGNDAEGVLVIGPSPRIQSTTAFGNVSYGIDISGVSASIQSSNASGNRANGILVVGNGARIKSSTASGNDGHGIEVDGDSSVIQANRADANGFSGGLMDFSGLGIWATGFTMPPVGTNVANGNDDVANCNPASLC